MIDLVFANNKVECKVYETPKVTDHSWINVELKKYNEKEKYRKFESRDYSKFHIGEFLKAIEERIAYRYDLDVNERADKFVQSIVDALDVVAPKKRFKISKIWEGKKWYSDEIGLATRKRDEAYMKAICTCDKRDWMQFKIDRNAAVKLFRKKKKEYYENMIDSYKSDPTIMWKTLKELIRGETTSAREINNVDFEILENIEECNIADKFNLYYIQSIDNIIKTTGECKSSKNSIHIIENKAVIENFELIDVYKLDRIIMGLPRKKGTDEGITSDLLKSSFHTIKRELMKLINDSVKEGICPEEWKISTIIPIPKIEKLKKASEYRPINILPIYEKVLELVVKEQIERYLNNSNIITEHQSGFRKNHSCETAIQTVIDDWKVLISEGEIIGVIFLDLKRAFETVDRDRLLGKLYQYGIRGMVLEWLKSYLSNRMQKVRFNNQWSKKMMTKYGVPQGSVLGPLLLLM